MQQGKPILKRRRKLTFIWRSVLEISFIIFLFYSNLLMGEYEHSGLGAKKGILWAVHDIFTLSNLGLAFIFAFIGYFVLEFFRRRL